MQSYNLMEDGSPGELERIRKINLIGIAMGCFGLLLFAVAANYFKSALWVTVVFSLTGFSSLLWNFLKLSSVALFIVCIGNALLFAIFHSYILTAGSLVHPALFAIQVCFLFLPFIVSGNDNDLKTTISVAVNVPIALSTSFLGYFFSLDHPVNFSPTVDFFLLLLGASILLTVIFSLIISSRQAAKRKKSFMASMLEKTKDLEIKEKKLGDYIKEVERTQEEERKRTWASEGIALVSDIMRLNDGEKMYDRLISSIVKHLHANQAALFIAEQQNTGVVMRLKACYAYDRKKFIDKAIVPGEGMAGQCFLEKESIYITHLREDYVNITSGLGGARPRALLITPLLVNENVEGIIEIASFTPFEKHQVQFVEQIASVIASAVRTYRMNAHTRDLLHQAQLQAEQIKSQEEEMRQNLEELTATQEEMRRKEVHLQTQADLMEFIIDNIPFPVFIKDEAGRYTLVNKAEAEIFNRPKSDTRLAFEFSVW